MKQFLRKVFSPILNPLESGTDPVAYKPSHRNILLVVSLLFGGLSGLIVVISRGADLGYLFPAVVFGLISLTGLVVALLGNDRAVAKIWGSR